MRIERCLWSGVVLTVAAVGIALPPLAARQGPSFDKLSDEDRAAFAARFQKEVWPLLQRDGKNGCVGCHAKTGGSLRFSGNAEKDFAKLLKGGFFLKGDPGSLLERVTDKDAKRRMPPKMPPWPDADVQVLRSFVEAVHAKGQ